MKLKSNFNSVNLVLKLKATSHQKLFFILLLRLFENGSILHLYFCLENIIRKSKINSRERWKRWSSRIHVLFLQKEWTNWMWVTLWDMRELTLQTSRDAHFFIRIYFIRMMSMKFAENLWMSSEISETQIEISIKFSPLYLPSIKRLLVVVLLLM